MRTWLLITLLTLPDAGAPAPSAQARLTQELKKELARDQVKLVDGKPGELLVRLELDAFEKVDPIWKILYSVVEESKRTGAPHLRVELTPHPEKRVCLQHEEIARGYLFKKQRADPARVTVEGNCGPPR